MLLPAVVGWVAAAVVLRSSVILSKTGARGRQGRQMRGVNIRETNEKWKKEDRNTEQQQQKKTAGNGRVWCVLLACNTLQHTFMNIAYITTVSAVVPCARSIASIHNLCWNVFFLFIMSFDRTNTRFAHTNNLFLRSLNIKIQMRHQCSSESGRMRRSWEGCVPKAQQWAETYRGSSSTRSVYHAMLLSCR